MFFYVLLIFAALHTGVRPQNCLWFNQYNCTSPQFLTTQICGTNHITYTNLCYFAKAHCKDPSINVLSTTSCMAMSVTHSVGTTTKTPSTLTIGAATNNSVCRDLPGFPCANMLKFGMCNDPDIADKCKQTCVKDEPGFACVDLLKFGMCGVSSIAVKCNHTCGQCYSGLQIHVLG